LRGHLKFGALRNKSGVDAFLGKAKFLSPGAFASDLSFETNVLVPYRKECFIEAVINLDRLIDFTLNVILASVYSKPEEERVANDFKRVFRLTGAKTAEILMHEKVVPQPLYAKINRFKSIRGLLAHDALGEYALLPNEQKAWENIVSQESFDAESKKKIDEVVRLGEEAFKELNAIRSKTR
jgi:hypothetical protein